MTSRYAEVYQQWQEDPQAFWAEAAKAIDWIKPPTRIFDAEAGVYGRWFPDAEVNACFNALDRQIALGRADQAAILYDSPVTATKRRITYAELLAEVQVLAAVLQDFGVGKGDRVIVYMPMIPEALVGMLACARIGAIHSVVFGGFAAKELATRIEDAEPKLVLTASCGVEPGRIVEYKPLLDLAIAMSKHKPEACILFQRPQAQATMIAGRDHDWARLVSHANAAGKIRRLRRDEGDRSALPALHVGHDRRAERRGARHRRLSGRARLVDDQPLRHQARRDLVDGLRHRLGGRPFLHRLRAAAAWLHFRALRGQAGRHARRRRVLARDLRIQGRRLLHRADRAARRAQGRPGSGAAEGLRSLRLPHAVPRRRARRPRDGDVGGADPRRARSSITGGRPKPAGRSRPIPSASG